MLTKKLKNVKCKLSNGTENLCLAALEMSQILELRAHAKHCYSINDLITDFLLVTAEDASKCREQHLILRQSTMLPKPTENSSGATNSSH